MTASSPAATPAPPAADVAPMSYLRYVNQFNALENELFFSDSARGLFHRLLYHFNKTRQWEASLPVNVPLLQLLTGSSPNTIVKGLAELQSRGVLFYEEAPRGRGKTGWIRLLKVHRIRAGKPSNFDDLTDGFTDDFGADEDVKPSVKPSAKPSKFDGTIREVRGVRDVTTGGPAAAKKNDPSLFSENPADASHTRGGATDVGTSEPAEGLRPLADGERLRGGFIDPRLSDSDPRKWEEIPQSVQMVDDYLASHPDPQVSKHAGSGKIFYDYYEGRGWMMGKEGTVPMRNWRAVARSYGYHDFNAIREAEVKDRTAKLSPAAGQLQQRSTGVEDAKQMFRKNRGEQEVQNG